MQRALRLAVTHPYRSPPELNAPEIKIAHDDDAVLGVMLIVLGGFRVVAAFAHGEIWRAEPTIALLMILCGLGLFLPRHKPLLDMFYVGVFLVLFILTLAVVGLLEGI